MRNILAMLDLLRPHCSPPHQKIKSPSRTRGGGILHVPGCRPRPGGLSRPWPQGNLVGGRKRLPPSLDLLWFQSGKSGFWCLLILSSSPSVVFGNYSNYSLPGTSRDHLLIQHIPKTGGTSFRFMIFRDAERLGKTCQTAYAKKCPNISEADADHPAQVVMGHRVNFHTLQPVKPSAIQRWYALRCHGSCRFTSTSTLNRSTTSTSTQT